MLRKCFAIPCLLFMAATPLAGEATPTTLPASARTLPWPATDGLSRELPIFDQPGPPRANRFVGIFYFLWHTANQAARRPDHPGPYDVSQILHRDPAALTHPDSPLWAPGTAAYYWGEPLYGYYLGADPWVLRRHAQLLSAAGIDTLIFDTTNAATYPEVYLKLCETFEDVRKHGGHTPAISFMVNTDAGKTAQKLYDDFYDRGLYRDLWFSWDGKPLMICDPAQASPELRKFFTLRAAHWPFELVNTAYAWHWEASYPQPYGYTDDPAKPEEVNVSVAQNLRAADSKVTNMSAGDARGRSFHDGAEDHAADAVNRGLNFQEQWSRALRLDPPFVMVTGWNEWIAGGFRSPGRAPLFVDEFNQEFSRDIEPMSGGHRDNYYYQLAANVRRYKGVPGIPQASEAKTIKIEGGFDQWQDVGPEFLSDAIDPSSRNFDGAAGLHYRGQPARNVLVSFKVARDAKNVYFYARARDHLTPPTAGNWMWLLLNTRHDASRSWEGYDYIVDRSIEPDGTIWLEKNDGGWRWKRIAKVICRVEGSQMQLSVPRAALGLADGAELSFDFKWADGLEHPGDIMDFYLSGSVAPPGRFRYRYQTAAKR